MTNETKRWHIRATVYRGNGQNDTEEQIIEGTREEAELDLWSLLEILGVDTAISEIDEE